MNYYPEQLRWLADLCEALNAFEKVDGEKDTHMMLQQWIKIVDPQNPDFVFGTLVDEIGGEWSFLPAKPTPNSAEEINP